MIFAAMNPAEGLALFAFCLIAAGFVYALIEAIAWCLNQDCDDEDE